MRRVYIDAKNEAITTYTNPTQRIIGAKDILSAKVNETLSAEGWTSSNYYSRQTFTCFMTMAGFEAGIPSWSSVSVTYPDGTTSLQYIIADHLPSDYIPPTGFIVYHNFNGTPTAQQLVTKIAEFACSKVGGTINRVYYEDGAGWRAEVIYNTVSNIGGAVGIGLGLRCSQTPRGGGGYILTSATPSGTDSRISLYHGANANQIDGEGGLPDIRFGKDLSEVTGTQGGYYGNIYPVFIFATPYTCSIVPETNSLNWQSVHCGALKSADSSFGICCYSYRKWLTTNGFTFVSHNGVEYLHKNLRLVALRYSNLNYQDEAVKWISGESQLSDVFMAMEDIGKYTFIGKLPYSYLIYDRLSAPDDLEFATIKKITPLSMNSGEGFSQGLGTLAHRTS